MLEYFVAIAMLLPVVTAAAETPMLAGRWDVRSTNVEMSIPGMPSFVASLLRGRSKVEHKRLTTGQGIEALLAPDPEARCRVTLQHVAEGRYHQTLTCPQKRGNPVQVVRSGTYDSRGLVGEATVTGVTAKGPMRIALAQRAARVGY